MSHTVLALGAWLKNAACLLRADGSVLWSPVHGDLGTPDACHALEASARDLLRQAGGRVDAVAHDLHPDFYSTQLALALADELGVPAIAVQHHHAHLAVVLAEQAAAAASDASADPNSPARSVERAATTEQQLPRHSEPAPDGPVVGLALDGVGLGTDHTAWGGELLLLHGADFSRIGHLQPLQLPGGDVAAREPWRMAAAALHAMGRGDEIEARFGPQVGKAAARVVAQMLARGLNCPLTTSTGRWFDAAAAALGLCLKQHDEAEAAMALEQAATRWLDGNDRASLPAARQAPPSDAAITNVDLLPVLEQLFASHRTTDADAVGAGAALFHLALADGLAQAAIRACQCSGSRQVLLGGGCFFNRLLSAELTVRLAAAGLQMLRPETTSCGDAGLALGQAWVAQQQLRLTHPGLTALDRATGAAASYQTNPTHPTCTAPAVLSPKETSCA